MAEIVNLRAARKARKRTEAEKTATANRAAFGRSKAEKQVAVAEGLLAAKRLDGARRTE